MRRTNNLNGLFYLNNNGSKWVIYSDGIKEQIYTFINGELIQRTVLYFESFGNFASACISYKGKKIKVLNFSTDKESLNIDSHNNKIN